MGKWSEKKLIGCGADALIFMFIFVTLAEVFTRQMCGGEEYARIKSPNHDLDAVLNCSSAGAMDSCHWQVHIVPTGQKELPNSNIVMNADHASIQMAWDGDTLIIDCSSLYPPEFDHVFYYDCPFYFHVGCKKISVRARQHLN